MREGRGRMCVEGDDRGEGERGCVEEGEGGERERVCGGG